MICRRAASPYFEVRIVFYDGCAGIRKKDYCILNRQYDKEAYEELRDRIIQDMKKRGEYGEFFPPELSTFGYNESAAQEQFPLAKEEALSAGFKWEDHPRGTYGKETVQWDELPESIEHASDAVAKEVFICAACEKNYRIIPDEFAFYKRLGIPLPRLCPDCRHMRRFTARGPDRTWQRTCQCNIVTSDKRPETGKPQGGTTDTSVSSKNSKLKTENSYKNTTKHFHGRKPCPNEFQTSYSPDRQEIVYCEACYNAEVV